MRRDRMLVVANSRKCGGHCVAGVSLGGGGLVRPVSPVGSGALSDNECEVDGKTPQLLEIVTFSHNGSQANPAQPENLLIAELPWGTEGLAAPGEALDTLLEVVDEGPTLFGNKGRAVPEYVAARGVANSLAMIVPADLRFGHGPEVDGNSGTPRVLFTFGGQEWSLVVTDFEIGPKTLQLPKAYTDGQI
jgi:hypothetical protein